jgi:hypothetical protein
VQIEGRLGLPAQLERASAAADRVLQRPGTEDLRCACLQELSQQRVELILRVRPGSAMGEEMTAVEALE